MVPRFVCSAAVFVVVIFTLATIDMMSRPERWTCVVKWRRDKDAIVACPNMYCEVVLTCPDYTPACDVASDTMDVYVYQLMLLATDKQVQDAVDAYESWLHGATIVYAALGSLAGVSCVFSLVQWCFAWHAESREVTAALLN